MECCVLNDLQDLNPAGVEVNFVGILDRQITYPFAYCSELISGQSRRPEFGVMRSGDVSRHLSRVREGARTNLIQGDRR